MLRQAGKFYPPKQSEGGLSANVAKRSTAEARVGLSADRQAHIDTQGVTNIFIVTPFLIGKVSARFWG